MTMRELEEGSVFAGRYLVVRAIAKGGMGAVYEVVHIETERRRALKVMLPHIVSSDELRQRFRQEARVAAKVESAYIVDVFDAGVDDETKMPFLVMELLRGEELGKRLSRLGRLSPRDVVMYLGQTALALDKTHRANIVHRDLKPENLFLAEQDDGPPRIKVLDFGIAKLVAEQGTEANATQSIGTPMYMAPEQFLPRSKVSAATDIFSLGMMAYTLLVGSPYWREEKEALGNVYAFVGAVMVGPMESATERALRQGVELPVAFEAWFARATARDPANRFGKASEAIETLGSVLGTTEGLPSISIIRSSMLSIANTNDVEDRATLVLPRKTPAPSELGAQATGFGLSSSHGTAVRMAGSSSPSVLLQRRRLSGVIAAATFLVASLVILVFVLIFKSQSTAGRALAVAPESATSVVPSSFPSAVVSANPVPQVAAIAPVMSASVSPARELLRAPEKTAPKRAIVVAPAPAPMPAPSPTSHKPIWGDDN